MVGPTRRLERHADPDHNDPMEIIMADATVQAESARANPTEEIRYLATEMQSLGCRVRSMADVIGTAADDAFTDTQETQRKRHLNNIINFADMIEREVVDLLNKGERLEILSSEIGGGSNGRH